MDSDLPGNSPTCTLDLASVENIHCFVCLSLKGILCIQQAMEPGSSGKESTQISYSLKSRVFIHSKLIYELLNIKDLIAELLNTRFRFLTKKEIKELYNTYGEQKRAGKLLLYLDNKKPPAIRRFIACILAETEHCGHKELSETIMNDLPEDEQQKIRKIVQQGTRHYRNEFVNINISTAQYCSELGSLSSDLENESISSVSSSDSSPEEESIETDSFTSKQGLIIKSHSIVQHVPPRPPQPMPLITLKGHLKGRSFDKLDRKLWSYFSTGQYSDLSQLTIKLRSHVVPDYQIIGMWFDSLIYMLVIMITVSRSSYFQHLNYVNTKKLKIHKY